MRLNVESSVVGSSITLLIVAGIIDWSTIAQFQAALARSVSRPRPAILLDFTGLLSWSPEAQAELARHRAGSLARRAAGCRRPGADPRVAGRRLRPAES
jgi:hypothetical protein